MEFDAGLTTSEVAYDKVKMLELRVQELTQQVMKTTMDMALLQNRIAELENRDWWEQ